VAYRGYYHTYVIRTIANDCILDRYCLNILSALYFFYF